ncbi:polysaccharide lyase family protein [Asticcacaulis solisilvae]|uniref:polysaccharide lyase family protein n=1 Tax=Asticcacaulis solisilvae TaxID=1217274 RepID=UPI003FD7D59A
MHKAVRLALCLGLGTALSTSLAHAAAPHVAPVTVNAPVTLVDNGDSWTLDNGIVRMTVLKKNGTIGLSSLSYHGVDIVPNRNEFWEATPGGQVTATITIDPATNGGERAEVSIKGINPGGGPETANDGTQGPGKLKNGGMDIEVRYTLERGTSGFYTYAEYSHPASYPAAGFGENRFILESMNKSFDWLSVDDDRNMLMTSDDDLQKGVVIHAKEQRILTSGLYKNSVEHKYSYNAIMYKLKAWGWSSTKDHVGVYFINPSNEYIGGGAEKLDLIDHMSGTLLDYWTSGHYAGGAGNHIPQGEDWKHVVGPIFVYMNALDSAEDASPKDLDTFQASYGSGDPAVPKAWRDNALALWNDAVEKSKAVKAAWPYAWVKGMDYPLKADRATVSGQLVLDDAQAATRALPHLTVGLSHPDYQSNAGGYQTRYGTGTTVTWPHDGNYYQFWADGSDDGHFSIHNVRPGHYTLHAFADGVLGEYARADITVEAGKDIDLGKLDWQPVRYGRQVWEIGVANRNGDEFYKGDEYWLWGWPLRYGDLFPKDVTYTIGKSDYRKDWFFEEVPHSTTDAWKNPAAKDPLNQRFGWVNLPDGQKDMWRDWGQGRATTWTVKFKMPKVQSGTAVLRIALAGADGLAPNTPGLAIGVNGQAVGALHPVQTNALRYNTDKGVWYQYTQTFDAGLLKSGDNTMTFTVPAGDVTTGVVWDYVRLEVNDGSQSYPVPPADGRPDMPRGPAQ